jgi:hypothetical protein
MGISFILVDNIVYGINTIIYLRDQVQKTTMGKLLANKNGIFLEYKTINGEYYTTTLLKFKNLKKGTKLTCVLHNIFSYPSFNSEPIPWMDHHH